MIVDPFKKLRGGTSIFRDFGSNFTQGNKRRGHEQVECDHPEPRS